MSSGSLLLQQLRQRQQSSAAAETQIGAGPSEKASICSTNGNLVAGTASNTVVAASNTTVAASSIAASMAILRQHTDSDDCWMVVHGRVLDVSAYMGHHVRIPASNPCMASLPMSPHC